MATAVTRTNPPSYTATQVTMANAAGVVELLASLYPTVRSTAEPVVNNNEADWQISIHQPGFVDQIANLTDWILTGEVLPSGPVVLVYTNEEFTATFTVPAGN